MNIEILQRSRFWLLYSSIFTLPMYMKLNNLLIGLFIAISLIYTLARLRTLNLKSLILRGWPVVVFFLLAVFSITHELEQESFKYLEKYWSFLLIPIAILSDHQVFNSKRRNIFIALVTGCLSTLIICYGNLVYTMIDQNESMTAFFGLQHVGHQFTSIADTHPTYLGIFIVASILFLIQDDKFNRYLKTILFLFLIIGLFQLANRMTILLFVFFFFFLLINNIKEL